jgi:hypothetical protein
MRIESKHLFSENISPFVKSIILKRRAGIKLTEQEENRFQRESRRLNEVVSMVEVPKNPISPTGRIANTFGNKKSIEDMDDDEEIDLDEILREMGYYDNEEEDELSDDELQKVLRDLELEDDIDESTMVNYNSKGYKEGMKLVSDLRRGLFRKLDNDELDDFMGALKVSFGLK